jgi:hypothetical protein
MKIIRYGESRGMALYLGMDLLGYKAVDDVCVGRLGRDAVVLLSGSQHISHLQFATVELTCLQALVSISLTRNGDWSFFPADS